MRSNRFVSFSVSLLASCVFATLASAATIDQFRKAGSRQLIEYAHVLLPKSHDRRR